MTYMEIGIIVFIVVMLLFNLVLTIIYINEEIEEADFTITSFLLSLLMLLTAGPIYLIMKLGKMLENSKFGKIVLIKKKRA